MTQRYVLYVPLDPDRPAKSVDWQNLGDRFGFKLVKERPTQATVEAEPARIEHLRTLYPEIKVTKPQKYHKLAVV